MGSVRHKRWAIGILCLPCIVFSGCSTICELARRTTIIEPSIFYWKDDKRRSLSVYSSWADAAWAEEMPSCPEAGGRPDYGLGFRDGFVDYVYAGGTGEPPPVPPRYLWNVENRSPEGRQRSEDWFAGYRHGARVARNGGYRSLATLQAGFDADYYDETHHGGNNWQYGGMPAQDEWPATETLPAPAEPTPTEAAPQPPNDLEPPRLNGPDAATPSKSNGVDAPRTKPVVPPAPRNLPPTTPQTSAPRGREPSPAESRQPEVPPSDSREFEIPPSDAAPPELPPSPAGEQEPPSADVPTNELRATDPFGPTPLETPPSEPNHSAPAEGGTPPESKSSSVRLLSPPATAGNSPRQLPRVSPPPQPIRAKAIPPRATAGSPSAIRLTAATSTAEPARTKPPAATKSKSNSSTIRIRAGANEPPATTSIRLAPPGSSAPK